MGDAGAAATTEAFLASLETGADAPTEVAVTGSEEPKRKRKRWGDKVEEPGAQVAPSPGGATPDVLTATQAAAAEALKKMNEALKGGGGAGSSQCMLDIEINDCPNKAALTKKSTQQEIMEATNVSILLRGTYKPPGSTSEERAIHLHLEARTASTNLGPNPAPTHFALPLPPLTITSTLTPTLARRPRRRSWARRSRWSAALWVPCPSPVPPPPPRPPQQPEAAWAWRLSTAPQRRRCRGSPPRGRGGVARGDRGGA